MFQWVKKNYCYGHVRSSELFVYQRVSERSKQLDLHNEDVETWIDLSRIFFNNLGKTQFHKPSPIHHHFS